MYKWLEAKGYRPVKACGNCKKHAYFQDTCVCKYIKTEWNTDSVVDPFGVCDDYEAI